MGNTAQLTIGQLATATGVPTSTIRFWERKALLPKAARVSGQRRYPVEAREWIVLLRKCQEAGLTLAEIRELQRRLGESREDCRDLLRAKVSDIDRRMADLAHARELLSHALACEHENITQCPNFRAHLAGWTEAAPMRSRNGETGAAQRLLHP